MVDITSAAMMIPITVAHFEFIPIYLESSKKTIPVIIIATILTNTPNELFFSLLIIPPTLLQPFTHKRRLVGNLPKNVTATNKLKYTPTVTAWQEFSFPLLNYFYRIQNLSYS